MKTKVYYSKVENPGTAEFDTKKEAEEFESYVREKGFLTKIETVDD